MAYRDITIQYTEKTAPVTVPAQPTVTPLSWVADYPDRVFSKRRINDGGTTYQVVPSGVPNVVPPIRYPVFPPFMYRERNRRREARFDYFESPTGLPNFPIPNNSWGAEFPDLIFRRRYTAHLIEGNDYVYFDSTPPPVNVDIGWEPTYADVIRPKRIHASQIQFNAFSLGLDFYPVPELYWENIYPDAIPRTKFRTSNHQHSVGVINLNQLPIPDLSWESIYVDRIYRNKVQAANQQAYYNIDNPITPPVPDIVWEGIYPDRITRIKFPVTGHLNLVIPNTIIPNPVPTFFKSENILPFRRKPFYGYLYNVGIFNYTDAPIPFNANRKLAACLNITDTWADHFTLNSWNSPQDQISAGYPLYCQPTLTSGIYEEIYDIGVLLKNTVITFTWSTEAVNGVINVVPKLAISTDGITYSAYNLGTTLFAEQVKFVKFRLEFATTGDKNVAHYFNLTLNFSTKREMDGGTVNVLAADTAGTVVNFNKSFKDVESITVTPLSTVEQTAIYDFIDVPNPTSFKILLYNTSGTRINGTVSWKARGIV